MNNRKQPAGAEAIVAAVNEDLKKPTGPRWDIDLIVQGVPNKMAISKDADIPPGSYLRWTTEDNVDDRLNREYATKDGQRVNAWQVVRYKDGAEKSGPVKLGNNILMAQPLDLHEAITKKRAEENESQKLIRNKIDQIEKGGQKNTRIELAEGGPA